MFSKTLELEEIEVWGRFLDPLPPMAVEYAFENWQRNGRFFPRPKDILDLVEAFKLNVAEKFKPCGRNGCIEGWVRVFEGKTEGGNDIDPKIGALTRCECWRQMMLDAACNNLCQSRHGRGYGTNDVLWLWKRYEAMKSSLPNRPMTDQEIDALLAELDSKREGGAPSWRRSVSER